MILTRSPFFLMLILALSLAVLSAVTPERALAAIEDVQFEDPTHLARYQQIIAELRCLVCQNQNLADSNAGLAKDLRRITADMLRAGNSDEEIMSFMRERYGDFVLYRPPFNAATAALWVGPFLLLIIAALGILLTIKRRQENELMRPTKIHDEAQRVKLRNLLANAPNLSESSEGKEKE